MTAILSAAEVARLRAGAAYARIALNGWPDGQWEVVPPDWTLATWAARVPDLATSHEQLRAERDAAVAALAIYEAALERLATWQSWAGDGNGAYLIACHPRCEALGALEEVNPTLDLRELGYAVEAPDA